MTQSHPHPDASEVPPVCPRHPDTVAYVRCQRCDRPVCPRCQVPSSVGVRCVDCARAATASRRPARTVLGGRVTEGAQVTKVLVALCVLAYLGQIARGSLLGDLAFVPAFGATEPYRFLTTAFLHASPLHLAFNMWALWVVGSAVEPLLGRWRFLALYLLSALGGSVMILWLADPASAPSWYGATVGASGAVFGVFAALFVVQRRFGRDTSAILGLLAANLVISLVGANISWQGHLGGVLTGAVVAAIYAWAPRAQRGAVGVVGTVVVLLALVALAVARYSLL